VPLQSSKNYGYFDDINYKHTKTNVVQYNEYYPFGLQTAESWTRPDDTRNPYLFNAGSEWNESSLVYETNFRDYDPAIGRFYANDPLSLQGHSLTPYRFGFNNPVSFNDPTGLYEKCLRQTRR